LASKQYISIVRLFNHLDIPTGEGFNLSRTKKQLQAEFGIAQGGFIEVDGFTYTRHDVFEEIDHPDFLKRFLFHRRLWNSPQLLQLIETNTANFPGISVEFKNFTGNKDFDEFFSPYFGGPFNYLSRTFLAEHKLKETGNLLSFEDFLQPAEREEAFRPIRVFLDESIRLLRNINRENYDMMRPKISHWIDSDWYIFFNNLPHEFYETKNDITTYLINIGVAVQKSHRRDCAAMSEQLVSLNDTPQSLREVITSNHAIYTRATVASGDGWSVSWRSIFWIGWILFMIFRGANSCGGNSTSPDIKFIPYDYNKFKVSDSLFKSIKDTNFQRRIDSLLKRK